MSAKQFIPLFIALEASTGVPAQYLYALAQRESRGNPRKVHGVKGEATPSEIRGAAVGLFQLTKGVVEGYNKVHGTSFKKRDMLDADRNARVAAWYLAKIIPIFDVKWNDARTIALLSQGWNSGPFGAKRIIEASEVVAPTVDDVKSSAKIIVALGGEFKGLESKAYRFLASRKTKWAKGVARDTLKAFGDPGFREPAGGRQSENGRKGEGAAVAIRAAASWLRRRCCR